MSACAILTAPTPQPLGSEGPSYTDLASEAVAAATKDAGLPYEAIEAAVSNTPTVSRHCWLPSRDL